MKIISDLICSCSGEKAKTSEWPTLVEVKGRVRLSAFGKFVQELPLSRSRVLMVYKVYYLQSCIMVVATLALAALDSVSSLLLLLLLLIQALIDPQNLISVLQVVS